MSTVGSKRVDFEAQLIGQFVKIGAAALVYEDFEQPSQAAGPRMRKHDNFARRLFAGSRCFRGRQNRVRGRGA